MKKIFLLSFLPVLLAGCKQVKKIYVSDSRPVIASPSLSAQRIVTEEDLEQLPSPVKKYLHLSGVIGQPLYMKGEFSFAGTFRMGKEQNWMNVSTMQVNDYESMTRVFYMKARMKGLSAKGRDLYREGKGNMLIKLTPFITLYNISGPEMDKGALVTLLNDLTLVPPAMLSPAISWEALDSLHARATITDRGIRVSGVFIFNEKGEVVDFYSDDRYQIDKQGAKLLRWSTPFGDYNQFGNYRIPSYGCGIWQEQDGPFEYARFHLQEHQLF